MTLKYIKGDLVKLAKQGEFEVIVQGCNCFCTMGSGIAKTIRKEFPEAYDVDQKTIRGDREKLGTITYCSVKTKKNPMLTIVNAYTQYNYGRDGKQYADYDAITKCMKEIKRLFSGEKIGLPALGAGLAGGDWSIISGIIEKELFDEDVTIVIFDK